MFTEEMFLRKHISMREWFEGFPMWPAILVSVRQLIIATGREQPAHGDVHEVNLLFFSEFAWSTAQLPYPYQKEEGFHRHGFAEATTELGIELPPFGSVVLVHFLGKRVWRNTGNTGEKGMRYKVM